MKTPNCKCLICEKVFYLKHSAISRGRGKFCSRKCLYKSMEYRVKKTCSVCNKEFEIKTSEAHKMIRCSRDCCKIYRGENKKVRVRLGIAKGERHWNWKGGITPFAVAIRMSTKYKDFRKEIFKRDDWTCVGCGIRGGQLQVDHIKPFSLYPDLIFDKNNVRVLCLRCHHETPTFGYKLMHLITKYGKEESKNLLYGK